MRLLGILTLLVASTGGAMLLEGCLDPGEVDLDQALRLYYENRLEEARTQFENAVDQHPNNARSHAWLGETYRRLGFKDEAIDAARDALRLDPCNTFGHSVIADASRTLHGSNEIAWSHLNEAISCDPLDGNVWVSIWGESVHRQDSTMWSRANRGLVESGFLTKAALDYGRWLLRTLPDSAILLTNGDMDTYPALAVQETEGLRPDVAVVERGLLDLSWGTRFIRDHQDVALPQPVDSLLASWTDRRDRYADRVTSSRQIINGWVREYIAGSFERPICLAVTVDEVFRTSLIGQWQYGGPFWVVQRDPLVRIHDTTVVKASIDRIGIDDFEGPWVSEQDRSPVRVISTKQLAGTITSMALLHAEWLVEEGRFTDAQTMVGWAERFQLRTVLGPVNGQRIRNIRDYIDSRNEK